jgi:hypothetical protein
VAGKLPRPRHQLVAWNAGKVPFERNMGETEFFGRHLLRGLPRHQQAIAAKIGRLPIDHERRRAL